MPVVLCRKLFLAFGLCLGLLACDSAEERAEKYFASALELIEAGDPDRAVIELRNVFELVPNHVEARETMARLMLDVGDKSLAYGQYLRLVEQVPDHVEGRTVLAEIAFEARNWEEFSRHAKEVQALAPDAPRSQMIALAVRYQSAIEARDTRSRNALRDQAEAMSAGDPDNDILQQILFDAYVRGGDYDKALSQLDRVLAKNPENRRLYTQRLGLLQELLDYDAMEEQLRQMVERFPEDVEPKTQLVQFLMGRGEVDKAEAFLREIADPAAEDQGMFVSLVRFLSEVRGTEAARAELESAMAVSPDPARLQTILAALDFESGDRDKAINALQDLLDQQGDAGEQVNTIRITLARMLVQTGNEVGAQRLVDQILTEDSTNVEALKMRAAWLIEDDDSDGAISALRLVLDTAQRDVEAMNLMADAYIRAGNNQLAQDFMALAVDASDNATVPTLRYARVLAEEERYLAAEEVLIKSLRKSPDNPDILVLLGEIYLASEDYSRADQVIQQLKKGGQERTLAIAEALQARLLGSREGLDQALGYLEELAGRDDASLNTQITLLRARLSSGQNERALKQAQELVSENPDNAALRFILASSHAATGNLDEAITLLKALAEEDPTRMRVWGQLYSMQRISGKVEDARQSLRDGLAVDPNDRRLLWAQALEFEADGDIDSAIANYEALYERNSNDVVAANNLASLLTTHKTDEESLQKAWLIARRFRDTDIPAMQDTYGWIAFRRGDPNEALPYLEDAASALGTDPIVNFHLGQVYAALDRTEDALTQYRRVLELAQDGDIRPQIDIARSEIDRLENPAPAKE